MYIPEHFTEQDFAKITHLVHKNPFGILISADENTPCVNHLPFLFEPNIDGYGKLTAHMARNNPQWKSLTGCESVIVVFNGAHGYVSPTLYVTPGVPTWNYAAVHMHGKPTVIEDPAGAERVLEKLTTHFEAKQQKPWQFNFPIEKNKLLQMIVAFEIDIQKIEGKFKLSQNRTPQEQNNIIATLAQSNISSDIELSKFMASYFV